MTRPDSVKLLREEIETFCRECAQDGDQHNEHVGHPKLGIEEMRKLKKLDAFIKETVRMNMPGWCMIPRYRLHVLISPSTPVTYHLN